MKKTLSILFASLILISGMHLTMATHFCGGVFAASKISFSGELASCGMESSKEACPIHGNRIHSDCCKDNVLTYSVDNNFSPSSPIIVDLLKSISQTLFIPINISYRSFSTIHSLSSNVIPPGELMANSVSLVDICVFRI